MFDYHQPNLENMQQYLSQENSKSEGGSSTNWWSIPSGMSSIRILPPWDPTGRVALPVYMHPIEYKGSDMAFTKYNWTCVNRTFGKPCAICEGLSGMAAAGVDISNWESKRRQFYFNAIVMHDPTYDQKGKGVASGTHVLMKAPKTFYDWVIAQITNPMIGDITSVTNGIDVYVTKEGSGLGTSYSMTLSPNGRTAIPQEYLEKITALYNLDEIFSAGFDQKQIDELVSHLKKSAGVLSSSVNTTVNQMAGYTQAPIPQYNNEASNPYASMQTQVPPVFTNNSNPAPSPFTHQAPPMSQTAANPFAQTGVQNPPWVAATTTTAQTAPSPAPSNAPAENLPKCFGNYDSGSVNCVVCNWEVDCTKKSNR